MPAALPARRRTDTPSEISRRELYFFNLFRVFQATAIAGLIFSPLAVNWVELLHPDLAHYVAVGYFLSPASIYLPGPARMPT